MPIPVCAEHEVELRLRFPDQLENEAIPKYLLQQVKNSFWKRRCLFCGGTGFNVSTGELAFIITTKMEGFWDRDDHGRMRVNGHGFRGEKTK